jgi:hypothetical protein
VSLPAAGDLALFMGLVLVLALYGLTVSTHFPAAARRPALKSASGAAVLWGTLAIAATVAGFALALAWRLPGPASVIGGGAMLLAAPLLLPWAPDGFLDGRAGLLFFAALAVALAAAATLIA